MNPLQNQVSNCRIFEEMQMKKIRKDIRVTQASNVADMILRLYKEMVAQEPLGTLAKDQNLAVMMGKLEGLSGDITTAIKREKISSNLRDVDLVRDNLIRRLLAVLNGYAAMPFAEKQDAAGKLLAVTSKYKGITTENYSNESALLDSMLEDLAAEELVPAIDLLDGVSILISDLKEAQANFKKESVSAAQINANKSDSAVKVKTPLLEVINDEIVPYLTGLSKMEAYKAFIAQCEAEITKANLSVTRKKSSDSEETPPEL